MLYQVRVANFKAKDNRIKKESIEDYIIYNKILNKILGTEEFRERFRELYEEYSGVICINPRDNSSQMTYDQNNQKDKTIAGPKF